MKTKVINAKPEKTESGIVADFSRTILETEPYLSLKTLYQFGETFARFHVTRGKTGMTLFRPRLAGSSQYVATRISTAGKRINLGPVEFQP